MKTGLEDFKIQHGSFQLRILLAEVSELRNHEEILGDLKSELVRDILVRNSLLDPIIVDSESKVVLDGTHRVAALREVGVKFAPICLVDYMSGEVRVKRWIRGVRFRGSGCADFLADIPVKLTEKRFEEAIEVVDNGRGNLAVIGRESAYLFQGGDPIKCSWKLREVEEYFRNRGAEISYLSVDDAVALLHRERLDLILIYSPIRKEDVVLAGVTGRLFAHKSTRHIVPARPLRVDVPIELLKAGCLKEANKRFMNLLSSKELIGLGRNAVVDGRRYEEYVYTFQ